MFRFTRKKKLFIESLEKLQKKIVLKALIVSNTMFLILSYPYLYSSIRINPIELYSMVGSEKINHKKWRPIDQTIHIVVSDEKFMLATRC